MYLLSFSQLLGKSLQMAVLMQIGGKMLVAFVLSLEVSFFRLRSPCDKHPKLLFIATY